MRKFKIDAGKIEVCRVDKKGYRSPGVIINTPPLYILSEDEITFQYIMGALPLGSVTIVETIEPLLITQPNLN